MVLGILAILLSVILPSFKGLHDETDLARATTELALLQAGLEAYYNAHLAYPEADYQTLLLAENERVLNQKYYDPFQSGKVEYQYYKVPGKPFYLLTSPGCNRVSEINPQTAIDLSTDTLVVPKSIDDPFVTNLKIERPE